MCTFVYWRRGPCSMVWPFCHWLCPLSPASTGHYRPCCTVTVLGQGRGHGQGKGAEVSHTAGPRSSRPPSVPYERKSERHQLLPVMQPLWSQAPFSTSSQVLCDQELEPWCPLSSGGQVGLEGERGCPSPPWGGGIQCLLLMKSLS